MLESEWNMKIYNKISEAKLQRLSNFSNRFLKTTFQGLSSLVF